MSQSLAKILVHTVFSTKDRRPFLRDQFLREEMHRYLGGMFGIDSTLRRVDEIYGELTQGSSCPRLRFATARQVATPLLG